MDHIEETVRRGTRVVDETGETQGGRRPDDQCGPSAFGAVSETSAMSGTVRAGGSGPSEIGSESSSGSEVPGTSDAAAGASTPSGGGSGSSAVPDTISETSAMSGATGAVAHVNEIVLIGRLSGVPEWKALPGGGQVAVWRLIVEHQDARSPQDAIDTIRCVTYDPSLQAGVRDWRHGDVIEVCGALRHRFWRGPAGPRGLYEVEATVAIRRHHAERGGGDRK